MAIMFMCFLILLSDKHYRFWDMSRIFLDSVFLDSVFLSVLYIARQSIWQIHVEEEDDHLEM